MSYHHNHRINSSSYRFIILAITIRCWSILNASPKTRLSTRSTIRNPSAVCFICGRRWTVANLGIKSYHMIIILFCIPHEFKFRLSVLKLNLDLSTSIRNNFKYLSSPPRPQIQLEHIHFELGPFISSLERLLLPSIKRPRNLFSRMKRVREFAQSAQYNRVHPPAVRAGG
jgi:hypothetical protein